MINTITKHLFFFMILFIGCNKQIVSDTAYHNTIFEFRKEKMNEFENETSSPLKTEESRSLLTYFEPVEKYKCNCTFTSAPTKERKDIPTSSGESSAYLVYGIATCKINGKSKALNLYRSLSLMSNPIYKNYLFLPFKDKTSGNITYGGGRFIDLKIEDIHENQIIIDFNKCYNPYCAYVDGYSCPIPPKENHLDIEIPVGEKKYHE
jgi:uncharacterized protein